MSKLGPKCQYFLWPQLFSSTVLTLLGMEFTRASEVDTGVLFHSFMTTSRSWWMLESLRSYNLPFEDAPHFRMPHRCFCPTGFRSGDMLGQIITFTLSVLEVRSLSCWNTALRPSRRREGIMLCFIMSQYMLAFMVPSMNYSSPVQAALKQLQTMTLPPPCLTVGKTHLSLYSSPGCWHTCLTPSEPNNFGLIRPQDMVPVIHALSLLVFSKLFVGFLAHHL